jgi:hypothetical protein
MGSAGEDVGVAAGLALAVCCSTLEACAARRADTAFLAVVGEAPLAAPAFRVQLLLLLALLSWLSAAAVRWVPARPAAAVAVLVAATAALPPAETVIAGPFAAGCF